MWSSRPLFHRLSVVPRRRGLSSTRAAARLFSSNSQNDRLLVVGSGVAGSAAALVAAELYKIPVTLLFAGNSGHDCNSYWAQGGIIYRNYDLKSGDSAESLANDIHTAGAGLCEDHAVQKVAKEGPSRVKQLLLDDSGPFAHVPFDKTPSGALSLCLEASHAAPRILHRADHTGKVITEHLHAACAKHPLITLQSDTIVTDLIVCNDSNMCLGVDVLKHNNIQSLYAARGVVLASGGLAGIYQHSTNPSGFNALGSSVALATRCNVQTQELEYVQFHPTSLNVPNEARFLLTEALRGEGAILRNAEGTAFAKSFHEKGELAPRDIVARGVFEAHQETGQVFLDITHRERDWLYKRFPTIQAHLQKRQLDLSRDWLPVIPAAHYTCGGVSTNQHGQTSLKHLYAAGEAARTGLHGGNRLASTSLLEGLVFGASVAEHVGEQSTNDIYEEARMVLENTSVNGTMVNGDGSSRKGSNAERTRQVATELLKGVRRTMWDKVGVVRTRSGLAAALEELDELKQHATELFQEDPTAESAGVRDAAGAGHAVAQAALNNGVSTGAHCIVPDEEEESSDDSDGDDELSMAAASAMQ